MQHASSFDILDLKIRVPPHLTSKFHNPNGIPTPHSSYYPPMANNQNIYSCNEQFQHHHTINITPTTTTTTIQQDHIIPITDYEEGGEEEAEHKEKSPQQRKENMIQLKKNRFHMRFLTVLAIGFCLGPLFWIVSFHSENNKPDLISQRAQQSACFFLFLSPFTLPTLISIQACHVPGGWFPFLLAWSSLTLGNTAAVLYCANNASSYVWLRMWLLSAAMIIAVIQNLLLVYKGNVILLMISTASGVLVCCLALVAPFLPSLSMTYRCFESMVIPMLWLCWQASLSTSAKTTTVLDKNIKPSSTTFHLSTTHCHDV